jgi:hypothetical protein
MNRLSPNISLICEAVLLTGVGWIDLNSIKCSKILEYLKNWWLFKTDSAPRSWSGLSVTFLPKYE